MDGSEKEETIAEFGHRVAAVVQRRLGDRWPKDEMEGFSLFHQIAGDADQALAHALEGAGKRLAWHEDNPLTPPCGHKCGYCKAGIPEACTCGYAAWQAKKPNGYYAPT